MALDPEELVPKKQDPIQLGADLSRFSVDELHERVAALQIEIERCRALILTKTQSRDAANAFFKR